MVENSHIAWTNHTFNPWVGCTKVGPGCDGCYAETWDARYDPNHVAQHWGPGAPRRRTAVSNWSKVYLWDREATKRQEPTRVFCASLADVLDNEAPDGARNDLWQLVRKTPHLHYQFLTKRIGNARKKLPADWSENFRHCGFVSTVVTQKECDRDLPILLDAKRSLGMSWVGLSIEPQLESVVPRGRPDWIITGGESTQGNHAARQYDPAWARMLINFGSAYGIKIFVKQMGSNPLGLSLKDRAGANPSEWPFDLRIRQFPETPHDP